MFTVVPPPHSQALPTREMKTVTKKRSLGFGAIALTIAVVGLPTAASAVAEELVPGILVEDTAHELPAPDVAVASDGRALVVYQTAVPGSDLTDPAAICGRNGGECSIVGRIIEADGATVGDPFLISGDVTNGYYYSAPQVYWNSELTEWVVVFNSYDAEPESYYGQRVDADGTLLGSLVEFPDSATTAADRTAVVREATEDHILAQLSWSAEDDAYIMSLYARDLQNGEDVILVHALTSALAPLDGVAHAMVLPTDGVTSLAYQTRLVRNATTGDWLLSWINDNTEDVVVNGVRLDGTSVQFSAPITVVQGSSVSNMWPQGGMVWVDSEDAALVTYGGQLGTDPDTRMEILGSYVSGDPFTSVTVSTDPVLVSDFGTSRVGTVIDELRSHETSYDSTSDVVRFAGTVLFRNPEDTNNIFAALGWELDPSTGVATEATEFLYTDDTELEPGVYQQSSRPQISTNYGVTAVVWQNWLGGDYEEPTQVRYSAPDASTSEAPELAETGPEESVLIAGIAIALLAAGAVLTVVRRRTAAQS